jgi:hypothetical protein
MAANCVSKVDEKRVDASVGHVSIDNCLLFFIREVNSKLFSMGEEGQSAVDGHAEVVSSRIDRKQGNSSPQ